MALSFIGAVKTLQRSEGILHFPEIDLAALIDVELAESLDQFFRFRFDLLLVVSIDWQADRSHEGGRNGRRARWAVGLGLPNRQHSDVQAGRCGQCSCAQARRRCGRAMSPAVGARGRRCLCLPARPLKVIKTIFEICLFPNGRPVRGHVRPMSRSPQPDRRRPLSCQDVHPVRRQSSTPSGTIQTYFSRSYSRTSHRKREPPTMRSARSTRRLR